MKSSMQTTITTGNTRAAESPAFRLSRAAPETKPTSVGPAEQPTSPASAIKAKSAVPAPFSREAARLKVPGQNTPTENPQTAHPPNPAAGLFVSDAAR